MTLGRNAVLTNPGRKRRRNEDAYVCEPPLFAVADGMGGAQAGEIASRLAAAALQGEGYAGPRRGEQRVVELIQAANRRVYERASEPDKSGMGTTMTVALVEDGRVAIGHVGDSRAYLVREGRLEQLTEDHSLVAELVRSGKLSPEEAEVHPQRSVITRALGTDPDVDVDTFTVETKQGDVFLLCSDGLTSMVADDRILALVERNHNDLDAAARALIKAANKGGGEDNITVVCFEIAAEPADGEETARHPALGEEDDEEDTLSGLASVPAVETFVAPPELADEWSVDGRDRRPGEGEHGRTRRRRRLVAAIVALSILAGMAAALIWGFSQSHFVGAAGDGHVTVYQGVPYDLAGNVRLYRAVYVSPLLAAQLTPDERRRLFDHDLRGYDAALAAVKRYEGEISP
jgi:serine/threonine protein phosphatase PrpC